MTETYLKTTADPRYGCADVTQAKGVMLEVAGKGTIELTMRERHCGPYAPAQVGPYAAAVAGGTGRYAGASGTMQFQSSVSSPSSCSAGCTGAARDTWSGDITVPGLEFDLTPPELLGIKDKTVKASRKAKRVRVKFAVTANDAVDGALRPSCAPRSGSLFKVGRTKVRCSATDTSANKASASFNVTVRRAR